MHISCTTNLNNLNNIVNRFLIANEFDLNDKITADIIINLCSTFHEHHLLNSFLSLENLSIKSLIIIGTFPYWGDTYYFSSSIEKLNSIKIENLGFTVSFIMALNLEYFFNKLFCSNIKNLTLFFDDKSIFLIPENDFLEKLFASTKALTSNIEQLVLNFRFKTKFEISEQAEQDFFEKILHLVIDNNFSIKLDIFFIGNKVCENISEITYRNYASKLPGANIKNANTYTYC